MDGWIFQGGYPLVSARLRDGKVELGQRRYLISGEDDDTVWDVPLLVRTSGGTEPVLIEPGGVSIEVAGDGPVVVNAGVHAFVRVEYDDELLGRLTADLRSLSTDERTQLVDDTWAAVVAGRRSAVDFCRFAESFAEETELPVWQSLLQGSRGASGSSRTGRASTSGRGSAGCCGRRSSGSAGSRARASATWTSRSAAR